MIQWLGLCTGWITSWNQDCQEKYQQPQISRWYHSNCRKWRETKKPLDEGERGKTKIMASGPITSWQMIGKQWKQWQTIILGSKITADGDCSHEIKRWYDKLSQHIKKQRHYFASKGPSSQSYGLFSSHVWMWEVDHKESRAEELMLLNCGVGEDSWGSLGL